MRQNTGILMRRPKGMTAEGLARKTQGRALFSKLLFLSEMEGLLPVELRDGAVATLLAVFGATSEDADALRIASLNAMDADALERLWSAASEDGGAASGESASPPVAE